MSEQRASTLVFGAICAPLSSDKRVELNESSRNGGGRELKEMKTKALDDKLFRLALAAAEVDSWIVD
jgi:hypothetical protein